MGGKCGFFKFTAAFASPLWRSCIFLLDTAAKIILWNSIRNRGFQSVKIAKVDKSRERI